MKALENDDNRRKINNTAVVDSLKHLRTSLPGYQKLSLSSTLKSNSSPDTFHNPTLFTSPVPTINLSKMRSTSILVALAALSGMAAAKRDCRRDRANPGQGWYWVVEGDTLNDIAADFDTTADKIADMNGNPNPDFIPAWETIIVPCKP